MLDLNQLVEARSSVHHPPSQEWVVKRVDEYV